MYGRCARVLVPSEATRAAAGRRQGDRRTHRIWAAAWTPSCSRRRAIDAAARRMARRRTIGRRCSMSAVCRARKGVDAAAGAAGGASRTRHRPPVHHRRRRPDAAELARGCPDAVFTGALAGRMWPKFRLGGPVRVSERHRHGRQRGARGAGKRPAGDGVGSAAGPGEHGARRRPGSCARAIDAEALGRRDAQSCALGRAPPRRLPRATTPCRAAGTWRSQPLYDAYRERRDERLACGVTPSAARAVRWRASGCCCRQPWQYVAAVELQVRRAERRVSRLAVLRRRISPPASSAAVAAMLDGVRVSASPPPASTAR